MSFVLPQRNHGMISKEREWRIQQNRGSPPIQGSLRISINGAFDAVKGKGGVGIVVRDEEGGVQSSKSKVGGSC